MTVSQISLTSKSLSSREEHTALVQKLIASLGESGLKIEVRRTTDSEVVVRIPASGCLVKVAGAAIHLSCHKEGDIISLSTTDLQSAIDWLIETNA